MGVEPILRNCVGSRSCEFKKNLDKTTEAEPSCKPKKKKCYPPLTLTRPGTVLEHRLPKSLASVAMTTDQCQQIRGHCGRESTQRHARRMRRRESAAWTLLERDVSYWGRFICVFCLMCAMLFSNKTSAFPMVRSTCVFLFLFEVLAPRKAR